MRSVGTACITWVMASIFSPLARISAFFCCLSARSRLYIGPNLLRPPRMRSARTAGRTDGETERETGETALALPLALPLANPRLASFPLEPVTAKQPPLPPTPPSTGKVPLLAVGMEPNSVLTRCGPKVFPLVITLDIYLPIPKHQRAQQIMSLNIHQGNKLL